MSVTIAASEGYGRKYDLQKFPNCLASKNKMSDSLLKYIPEKEKPFVEEDSPLECTTEEWEPLVEWDSLSKDIIEEWKLFLEWDSLLEHATEEWKPRGIGPEFLKNGMTLLRLNSSLSVVMATF